MASTIQVDKVQDTGGNTILSSNSTGTFTNNLPANLTGATGTLAIAQGGTGAATLAAAGLANTPAFHAYLSADQDISDGTRTKITINNETYDSDGCYDHATNYRFTPTTAGKYFVYTSQMLSSTSNDTLAEDQAFIYKNGSEIGQGYFNHSSSYYQRIDQPTVSITVDMNGTSDYLEAWAYIDVSSGTPRIWGASYQYTYFGAYKIIGA